MLHATRALSIALALTLTPALASAQESQLASLRAAGRDGANTLRLGRALRRAGHFDEAVRTLQGVHDSALRNDALWEIARVRFDQGVFQAARGACMTFPMPRNNPQASFHRHVCMGRAYLVWNRVALAEREVNAARAINPNDPELQLVIADSRRLASDLQGAETAYHSAAQGMPGRDEPLLGLGHNREWAILEMLLMASPNVVSKSRLVQALAGWDKDITPNAV